eukprot:CAMPEP_0119562266 /NCGR_PEP_ID=MMETSP1352-20130426/19922_1 /TAXON_ID=265584 /ORGANISM="Stauroneis constricta, Strain CCMP1120" /LENGTH=249 /DNA_ID=CAMNT_0007610627 /DNA_START=168 /DNA_END=917 /DNA_ORIENTATION=-
MICKNCISFIVLIVIILTTILPSPTTAVLTFDDLCNSPELVYGLTVYDDKYTDRHCKCDERNEVITCSLMDRNGQCSDALGGGLCTCRGANCLQRVEIFVFDKKTHDLNAKTTCDRCLSTEKCDVDEFCVRVYFRHIDDHNYNQGLGKDCEVLKLKEGGYDKCKNCEICTDRFGVQGIERGKCFGQRESGRCETDEAYNAHPFQIEEKSPSSSATPRKRKDEVGLFLYSLAFSLFFLHSTRLLPGMMTD